ncbi:sn-glycerol-3-phosphate ABC transporter ATP-binding protein UgpC [Vibrio sp. JC009]|uniref:ABC transporter ATP-binding protein n=1 Tax=Vibrio sp. JC009 TaxID=2912314 RepID=UPI0023AE7B81|nr:sn-glycerol-3-phosphate ABC transporter ATP-binding protein UgpC [Vibrio sp. JC009]WED23633.1 sn-glycerol-3-phosphate ABC transporter ATP-binding protein UgpC [Vibrio sp. JC009]
MSELSLNNICKSYNSDATIIPNLDLDVKSGEFVVIVGPSGCGKSTLLRMIAGLEDITSGDMKIDGNIVNDDTPSERGIGMVFQSYALYPHMDVRRNMGFALELAKLPKEEIKQRVDSAAKILQLEHLMDRKPKDLSGGQRQRVAIGRSIAREPKLFLFDEPLSNLDASLRVQMRMEIANLHKRLKSTIIYVTHDQVEAMTLADRIVVLNRGNVEQVGTPLELYDHPENLFVAQFIGSPKMNTAPVTITMVDSDSCTVQTRSGDFITLPVSASHHDIGKPAILGVRPEHLDFTESNSEKADEVMFVEQMGNETYLYVDKGYDEPWVVRMGERNLTKAGCNIELKMDPSSCYLFDVSGRAYQRLEVKTQH